MKKEIYAQARSKVFDKAIESEILGIPALNYIMGVDKMSDTDKIFYNAYKKYGNRNHTWQDFKQMFNNDIDAMKKSVKHWRTWNEINKKYSHMHKYLIETQQLLKKHNLKNISETDLDSVDYQKKYPDLASAFKKYIKAEEQAYTNYSTFDKEISDLKREFEKSNQSSEKLIPEYIIKMFQLVNLKNADFIVGERIETYKNIILENENLLNMAQKFKSLSGSEKVDFARMILDASAKKHGLSVGKVIQDDIPGQQHKLNKNQGAAYCVSSTNFLFNSTVLSNLTDFLTALAHEDAHRIDYQNPNFGMIGGQIMDWARGNYINNASLDEETYRKQPTELSSYYLDKTVGFILDRAITTQKKIM